MMPEASAVDSPTLVADAVIQTGMGLEVPFGTAAQPRTRVVGDLPRRIGLAAMSDPCRAMIPLPPMVPRHSSRPAGPRCPAAQDISGAVARTEALRVPLRLDCTVWR